METGLTVAKWNTCMNLIKRPYSRWHERWAVSVTLKRAESVRHVSGVLLAVLLLAGFVLLAEARHEVPQTGLGRLDSVMASYIEDGRVAGSVVLIRRGDRELFYKAYGFRDREAGAPMQKDTIFRLASQTKAIVSVGVMQLQERGKLLIGDAVGKYFPEYQKTTVAVANEDGGYDVVPANRPITIRDLLTHTAGIGYGLKEPGAELWAAAGIQDFYFADRNEPIRETVRRIADLPFIAQPGEQWVYGYNTDILGALIEVVSGQPLDEYLHEFIFEPLGMSDTHFYLPDSKRDRLAVVYTPQEDGSLVRSPDGSGNRGQGEYIDGPRKSFSGGGGLLSTAADYGRFLQAMLNGGTLGETRLLSPNSVQLMTVDHGVPGSVG